MEKKYVTYEEFGAKGDGKTDDYAAICKAHSYANENGLPVKANGNATYYICSPIVDGERRSATIRTDVDWGTAKFIIDDSEITLDDPDRKWHGHIVFRVASDYPMYKIEDEETLRKVSELGITKKSKKVAQSLLKYRVYTELYLAHKGKIKPDTEIPLTIVIGKEELADGSVKVITQDGNEINMTARRLLQELLKDKANRVYTSTIIDKN